MFPVNRISTRRRNLRDVYLALATRRRRNGDARPLPPPPQLLWISSSALGGGGDSTPPPSPSRCLSRTLPLSFSVSPLPKKREKKDKNGKKERNEAGMSEKPTASTKPHPLNYFQIWVVTFALIFKSSVPVMEAVNKLSVLLAFTILLNSVQPILYVHV